MQKEESVFRQLYSALMERHGRQDWWPAETTFEMMIGAVLVQNTAWVNVEKSIFALKETNALTLEAMLQLSAERLQIIIRPSGFMKAKSKTCLALCRWICTNDALENKLGHMSDDALRSSLLGLSGIGPETADVIMLYAYDRPIFIWDTYARRLLSLHGFDVPQTYEKARRAFASDIAAARFSLEDLAQFHALIVEHGKQNSAERLI